MNAAPKRSARKHAGGPAHRRRGPYLILGLASLALLGAVVVVVKPGEAARAGASVTAYRSAPPGPTADVGPSVTASASAHITRSGTAGSPTGPAGPTPGGTNPSPGGGQDGRTSTVSEHGTGVFTTAQASGDAAGGGRIRRFKVEVEDGTGISAAGAAEEIRGILASPRGWTRDGHDGFQLVSSGDADFVVKIATPDTVDAICGAAGLHTHGEVNCDVGPTVVVNLKRWMLGSPQFPGPIHDYRALIVNHEVGHRIGHGHEGCPGPGRPAPVMMQQIDGLHGCTANAWPYDADGRYLQGPSVP
ncbi:DUF3152 domain-containing protein [Streptantibioticus cattleyicolor]|uniref:Lipoprotein n=1 Tax=Streptantibioticus cattleyicolor (strain ATCC 35852 / DSM 46488 / JCM 4925 / NBRC 14057 / NRRL 8057) TaxID=1003195 RepID=F8JLA5_STREN|nr:DUF3152 domain-containing protein [Streptantibioticus cattleyicolor]AEW99609.1 lipoprotein [Streptantibioticus cattleyicolor NRRL 8057 = DSM 46488]CCB71354.1 putative membrane protein [Streptantibioticus cattleyicolor NRRL 8057 = DSM 46488]